MRNSRIIQTPIAVFLLSACVPQAKYEDISSDPSYRSLVGRELRASSSLSLHAITLDRNYANRVDLCSVTPPPGFDGPEVISRGGLAAGTSFRVLSVRRCANCSSPDLVELLVSSESTAVCGNAPVKINLGALGSTVLLVPGPSG